MKKKLLAAVFVVMFLLGTMLTMNVFGVDPSAFTPTDSEFIQDEVFLEGVILRIIEVGSLTILFVVCFINLIKYLRTDKADSEKRKKIRGKILLIMMILFMYWIGSSLLGLIHIHHEIR